VDRALSWYLFMVELLNALTEFLKELPDPYKSALLPAIIVMLCFRVCFKVISWNQEAGLIKLPAIKKKERLESINFLAEQIKDSLNEPEEILYLKEKRSTLLFEETFGFLANKSMRKLINDFQAVAPFPMNNSKFISNASRYLFNEDNKLTVKLGWFERIYVLLCILMCAFLFVIMQIYVSLVIEKTSFVGVLVSFFLMTMLGFVWYLYLRDITSFFMANKIKAFIEKDKPKKTFQQWLELGIRSFKSVVWMPKSSLQSSEVALQKMTHSEELFSQKGQNH
jgi:hypothetical protein